MLLFNCRKRRSNLQSFSLHSTNHRSSHGLLCLTHVFNAFATIVYWDPRIFAKRFVLRTFYSKINFFVTKKFAFSSYFNLSILERERAMVFPDYYFFAERYLVNHTIEKKRVHNLDDCELMCYLNDDCVSLNFKKDPEDKEPLHICELNNATHLKYDSDLTTDANFYYRGSRVSYKSIFRNCRFWTI